MQGNCAGAFPSDTSLGLSGAPLLPLLPYQCLLIADVQLLSTTENSQLWLDGLYVRYSRTGRYPLLRVLPASTFTNSSTFRARCG
jgi:hypothetical protein